MKSYESADLMASLVAGDISAKPAVVGFIYAPSAGPAPADPNNTNEHTIGTIGDELAELEGNMVVSPVVVVDRKVSGDQDNYTENAVIFASVSDNDADPVFGPGGGFTSAKPTPGTHKFFQVALLAAIPVPGSTRPKYRVWDVQQLNGSTGVEVNASTGIHVIMPWVASV